MRPFIAEVKAANVGSFAEWPQVLEITVNPITTRSEWAPAEVYYGWCFSLREGILRVE
jgi:hypothetical protein